MQSDSERKAVLTGFVLLYFAGIVVVAVGRVELGLALAVGSVFFGLIYWHTT